MDDAAPKLIKKKKKKVSKVTIGWEEWCAFPDLNLPAIRAKTDTGAKTSALHADHIEPFIKDGVEYVRFTVHPIRKNRVIDRICEAPVADYRNVTSSNGKREKRYVINTTFIIGEHEFKADLTLTRRYGMSFRMLLGKEALKKGKFIVDVAKTYAMGRQNNDKDLYL